MDNKKSLLERVIELIIFFAIIVISLIIIDKTTNIFSDKKDINSPTIEKEQNITKEEIKDAVEIIKKIEPEPSDFPDHDYYQKLKKINLVSSTEDRKAVSKFVGFLPGSPAAIIELLRDPSLVLPDLKTENPEEKLIVVFSGDEDYHKWFFYGWSRYKNRIVLIVPSILYPEALVYKNAGEAIEIYQGLFHLNGSNINRRKALVSWFIFALIGMSLLRLFRVPVFIWRVRRFKKYHKMMK